MEGCLTIQIEVGVKGNVTIYIEGIVDVSCTNDINSATDDAVTIVSVNNKLSYTCIILDQEFFIVSTDNQVVSNFCLKLDIQGAFDNSVTCSTFDSNFVYMTSSPDCEVGIDVNSAVNLSITLDVGSATNVEVGRDTYTTSHHQGACCGCLPSRICIGGQSEVTSNDSSVSARINFA